MALVTDATVIIEASEKSGTRHQGWEALRLGRLVLLLENLTARGGPSWVPELVKYGAEVLSRDRLALVLLDLAVRPRHLHQRYQTEGNKGLRLELELDESIEKFFVLQLGHQTHRLAFLLSNRLFPKLDQQALVLLGEEGVFESLGLRTQPAPHINPVAHC